MSHLNPHLPPGVRLAMGAAPVIDHPNEPQTFPRDWVMVGKAAVHIHGQVPCVYGRHT